MADFQGIFCHPFLPSALIIEGVGGMGGKVGWGGIQIPTAQLVPSMGIIVSAVI